MKTHFPIAAVALILFVICQSCSGSTGGKLWVTAYYAGWMQGNNNTGHLPAQDIDYSAVTHIIHFSLIPKPDGTIDTLGNGITAQNSAALISRAHAAGKKVLIAVGGTASAGNFLAATNEERMKTFIGNLLAFVARGGYDGIDIDWEVLREEDGDRFTDFITLLRHELNERNPRPLLTAAAGGRADLFAKLQDQFDQINLMTYDMAGAWPGWPIWYNSPLYDGGATFPSNGKPLPSIHGVVQEFLNAGVAPEKLGIGIDYYGYVWQNSPGRPSLKALYPGREASDVPVVQPNIPFYDIMARYHSAGAYCWDSLAQASYLHLEQADGASIFVSYDDERTCGAKVYYAKEKRLGGVMIWELGGGYLPTNFSKRDRLLQAVKAAVH